MLHACVTAKLVELYEMWNCLFRLESYKSLSRSKASSVLELQHQQQQVEYATVNKPHAAAQDPIPPNPSSISADCQPAPVTSSSTSSVPPAAIETTAVATKTIVEPIYAVVDKERKTVEADRTTSPTVGNCAVSATSDPPKANGEGSASTCSSVNAQLSVTYATIDDCRRTVSGIGDDSRTLYAAIDDSHHSEPLYESIDEKSHVIYSDLEPYATFRPFKPKPDPNPEKTGTNLLLLRVN